MGARIAFWDESGISQKPNVRRTWSPRGHTPLIRSTGSWRSRSAAGIITATPYGRKPKLLLRILTHSIASPDIVRVLKELRRHVRGALILVWDGLPAHRSRLTRAFLKTQASWLTVYRFPAYAPELNPVEYLWSAGKNKELANLCVDTINDIDTHIRSYKRRVQRHPHLLSGFLKKSGLFQKELST